MRGGSEPNHQVNATPPSLECIKGLSSSSKLLLAPNTKQEELPKPSIPTMDLSDETSGRWLHRSHVILNMTARLSLAAPR